MNKNKKLLILDYLWKKLSKFKAIRTDFLEDIFGIIIWFVSEVENNARNYFRHTCHIYVAINAILRNFCSLYKCDF